MKKKLAMAARTARGVPSMVRNLRGEIREKEKEERRELRKKELSPTADGSSIASASRRQLLRSGLRGFSLALLGLSLSLSNLFASGVPRSLVYRRVSKPLHLAVLFSPIPDREDCSGFHFHRKPRNLSRLRRDLRRKTLLLVIVVTDQIAN
ncbi:hypothetical protein TIFTF001_017710 [Ficus carica]|uniref:Uncharacterized protein n=1 Tax=Ficus carica TaxID=3494 RepID=A0AA88A5M1_FICCA|nr:hypothetical protein TIFTF001_017710 [Ficus carica]